VQVVAQGALHDPQLVVVLSGASQPLLKLPSQLPKPGLQVMPQAPPEQLAVPLLELQALEQDPQLAVVSSGVSQPLPALPSQLPKPALQIVVHALAEQTAVPLVDLQILPQTPQLLGLLVMSASQPLVTSPSQLP
jgi:hypothetical protein